MNKLLKGYCIFTAITGIYGFSRGYRSMDSIIPSSKNNKLFGTKVSLGIINGIFYMFLPFQVDRFFTLINRIEIKKNNLDRYKDENMSNYKEFVGYCHDTF